MIIGDMIIADWFVYLSLGICALIVIIVIAWFYKSRLKIGYKAVFSEVLHGVVIPQLDGSTKMVGGVRICLGEKEFNASDKVVEWKGKKFQIDLGKPAYRWYGWTRFYYDFGTGDILTFGGRFQKLDPNDGDIFMSDGLVGRMVEMVKKHKADMMVWLVVTMVMAGLFFAVGLLSSPYIIPSPYNGTVVTP